jgi:hypothetical protein
MTAIVLHEQSSSGQVPQGDPTTQRTVGEHEAKIEGRSEKIEDVGADASLALAIAESTGGPHTHEEYVSKADLEAFGDSLVERLQGELVVAPPEPPPAPTEKTKDSPPKSREKRVRRKGIAERFYNNA